jgi:hypothetical protein
MPTNTMNYDHATHYDYDIHGNVKTLLQDNRKMATEFASLASQRLSAWIMCMIW